MTEVLNNVKMPVSKIKLVNFANDLFQASEEIYAKLEKDYGFKVPEYVRQSKVDISENVRELYRYEAAELDPLIDSINEDLANGGNGIKESPVYMEGADGKLRIIQGHRRTVAGIIAGVKSVRAVVYPMLTRQQFMILLLDHGQRASLNQVEVFYSIENGYKANLTQKQLAVELRPLLEQIKPLTDEQKKNIAEKATEELQKQALLDAYRGRIQGHIRVCNQPEEVRIAWINRLRGKQKWPTENDVRELDTIFLAEKKTDPTVTKANPGPKWKERWQKILDAVEAGKNEGKAVKATGMMNRKDVDELAKRSDSVFVRVTCDYITRNLPDEQFAKVLEMIKEIESKLTPDQLNLLKRAYDPTPAQVAEVQVETPVEEAKTEELSEVAA